MEMKLQTKVEIPKAGFSLNFREKGLFVGSCFALSIEKYLRERKAAVTGCPYGEMYNPLSIRTFFESCFGSCCGGPKVFGSEDVVLSKDGLWYSWLHHGSICAGTKEELLAKISINPLKGSSFDYIVVTLGTSWVYQLVDGRVVANCHKMPSGMFRRRSVSVEETVEAMEYVLSLFPTAKFILTVSPIRHIKDGLSENSFSKSLLRVAAGILERRHENVYYFPSYEIMNDELRDYRFYKEDMVHPSDQAVDYIVRNFAESLFDEESLTFFLKAGKLLQASSHRPLHPESGSYAEFKNRMTSLRDRLAEEYGDVDFSDINF